MEFNAFSPIKDVLAEKGISHQLMNVADKPTLKKKRNELATCTERGGAVSDCIRQHDRNFIDSEPTSKACVWKRIRDSHKRERVWRRNEKQPNGRETPLTAFPKVNAHTGAHQHVDCSNTSISSLKLIINRLVLLSFVRFFSFHSLILLSWVVLSRNLWPFQLGIWLLLSKRHTFCSFIFDNSIVF